MAKPTLDEMIRRAFDLDWRLVPRSAAYRRGAKAGIRSILKKVPGLIRDLPLPYPTPSAKADAWLTGFYDGQRYARTALYQLFQEEKPA
jgi:hypothetical protein